MRRIKYKYPHANECHVRVVTILQLFVTDAEHWKFVLLVDSRNVCVAIHLLNLSSPFFASTSSPSSPGGVFIGSSCSPLSFRSLPLCVIPAWNAHVSACKQSSCEGRRSNRAARTVSSWHCPLIEFESVPLNQRCRNIDTHGADRCHPVQVRVGEFCPRVTRCNILWMNDVSNKTKVSAHKTWIWWLNWNSLFVNCDLKVVVVVVLITVLVAVC